MFPQIALYRPPAFATLFLCGFLLSSSLLLAQEESGYQLGEEGAIRIENAGEAAYIRGQEDGRGMVRLQGRVRVYLPQGHFVADTVIIDTNNLEIYGSGNLAYYEKGKGRVEAERIIYNRRLQQGIIYSVSGDSRPIRFLGKNIRQLEQDRFSISDVRFTADEARPPHYYFIARRLWLYEDGAFFAAGVWYYIGGIPVLPLPFFYSGYVGTGIITQAGQSDLQGFFLQNTYQFGTPQGRLSSWAPTAWRFQLDWYQNSGEALGAAISRQQRPWSYYLDLGLARHQRYEVFSEDGELQVTNQILDCPADGSECRREEQSFLWHKIFLLSNYSHQRLESNRSRNLQIRFEHYRNWLYDYEYGGRYVPESTLPALYVSNTAGRHPLRTTLDWDLDYSEQWDQLSLYLQAKRRLIWREERSFEASEYEPASELLPHLEISYSWLAGRLPFQEAPIYWKNSAEYGRWAAFEEGEPDYRFERFGYRSLLSSSLGLSPYISLGPGLGYGLYKTSAYTESESEAVERDLLLEAERNSYQYLFTENELILGPDSLFLRLVHHYKRAFAQEEEEGLYIDDSDESDQSDHASQIEGFQTNQNIHATELALEFYPIWGISLSAESSYDHRPFPDQEVGSNERWSYPILRGQAVMNWFNALRQPRENMLSRRRAQFLTTILSNSYIYDPIRQRDHSNIAGISLEMGGFDLWPLKHLRLLETALYWYHLYFDPSLDHIRFTLQSDLQLWSWGYLEIEWESRAIDPQRYSQSSQGADGEDDSVSFLEDIANSSGLSGLQRQQEALFNIAFFRSVLVLDLHDWEFRLGYQLEQRNLLTGGEEISSIIFYDSRIFFSMGLSRFDIGGYGQQPGQFWIDRRRPRASDFPSAP